MCRFILYFYIFCNLLFALEPSIVSNNKSEKISQLSYFESEGNFEKAYEEFKKRKFIKFSDDVLIEIRQSNLSSPRINNNLGNLIPKFHLEKSSISFIYLIKIDSSLPSFTEILIGNNSDITNVLITEIGILFIFIGSFLSFFFYNILLYLSKQENDYALYSMYILFLFSWIISFHSYFTTIFGFNFEIKKIIEVFILLGTLVFLLLFSFKFLEIQNKYQRKLYLLFLSVILIFFIRELFSYFISILTLICVTIFCICLGIEKFIHGYSYSKYYVLGLSGYLIGIVISFCVFEGFIEVNFYTVYSQLIGSLWAIIFLSLALEDKLSLIQFERNNAILKEQIEEKVFFLQSVQASVGELVGNITHQWREPLAEIGAIQTNLHATLLIKGSLTKEKILDSIEQSSVIIQHLSETIDVFYRFFKNEKSNKSEFGIIYVMNDIRKLVHYILEIENISFHFEYKNEIYLFADRYEFSNVIINIILNAKDILVERRIINPYIKIKINQINNSIIITIEDNAGGIKQEPLEKIFESGISSKNENIGLGLYIVKTIIEKRLGGEVNAKNNELGAIFTISLPFNYEILDVDLIETDLNIEESTLDKIYRLESKVKK